MQKNEKTQSEKLDTELEEYMKERGNVSEEKK